MKVRPTIRSQAIDSVSHSVAIADPVGRMREVYSRLGLGDFANVEPAIMRYAMKSRDYQTNKYSLPPEAETAPG